jgi:hypothetical protein
MGEGGGVRSARASGRLVKIGNSWSTAVRAKMRSTEALVMTSRTSPPSASARLWAWTSALTPAESQNTVWDMSTTTVGQLPLATKSAPRSRVALLASISAGVDTTTGNARFSWLSMRCSSLQGDGAAIPKGDSDPDPGPGGWLGRSSFCLPAVAPNCPRLMGESPARGELPLPGPACFHR